MLKTIILLLLPLVFFMVSSNTDERRLKAQPANQSNKKQATKEATRTEHVTTALQETETLEDLFLEDDFDITDLVNRRDKK